MLKIVFPAALLLSLCVYALPQDRIIALPTSLRRIQIAAEKTIPVLRDGQSQLEIVLPAGANRVLQFAAAELQEYFRRSCQVELPVVNAPNDSKVSIILGDNQWSRQAGLDCTVLPRDGYYLKSVGRRIYIAGVDDDKGNPAEAFGWSVLFERGTLNGVYEFLERFLGIRFYFPGEIGTVVPKHQQLNLPQMDIYDRPDFPRRRYGAAPINHQAWFPEQEYHHRLSGRMNLNLRTESFYVPCCHSMERLKIVERFADKYPDILAMDEHGKRHTQPGSVYYGNLCYTSPSLRDELFRDAVSHLSGEPAQNRGLRGWDPSAIQPGFFNIMPKDHFRTCYCPRCREFYQKHPESELVWDLVANIAGRLRQAGVPGYVTAMGYGHYPNPPQTVSLPDNVLIMISVRGPWAENIPAARAEGDQRIKIWTDFTGRKPWLWNATYKYGGLELPDIPPTTPRIIGKYYVRQAGNISGAFMESESDHWIFSYLNYYSMAKSTWDNTLDPDALVDEHHRKMFGPAAVPMGKFFDRIEELWLTRISGRTVETRLGFEAVPPSDNELWEQIYSPAEFEQFDQWFDAAAKLCAGHPEEAKRVDYFRRHFLGQIKRGAERYQRLCSSLQDLQFQVQALSDGEAIVLDGKPDEAAWQPARAHYLLPLESEKGEVATTLMFRYDQQYLYLGAVCTEPKMEQVVANMREHDNGNIWTDSVLEVFLNPSADRSNYFHWIINSLGYVYDAKAIRQDTRSQYDPSWNSGAKIQVARSEQSWSVEMAIPLSALPDLKADGFPANVGRFRVLSEKPEVRMYSLSPFVKGFHDLEYYGTMVLTPQLPASLSLLNNGDFRAAQKGASFGDWHSGDIEAVPPKGDIISLDRQYFRVGGQALRIQSDGSKPHGVTQYLPQLKPNRTYHVTFQVRCENIVPNKKGGGAVVNYGDVRNNWYPANWYTGSMPWTRQGFLFRTGPETNQDPKQTAWIRLAIYSATGTVWFDDLQMREIEE